MTKHATSSPRQLTDEEVAAIEARLDELTVARQVNYPVHLAALNDLIAHAPTDLRALLADRRLLLDVVEAAKEIVFVFGSGGIEQSIHRNDLNGLRVALDAL